ncbi:hypothetical protein PRUPE_3G162400 [Prunus persica]|uniref:Uncharacterized protein n=1 Tax=Prunus persica TaxID=3760 RepID=A0A251Q116_PRUPE|nr:hypothetical protein PRUPE_3G162400 [Prunus persica]
MDAQILILQLPVHISKIIIRLPLLKEYIRLPLTKSTFGISDQTLTPRSRIDAERNTPSKDKILRDSSQIGLHLWTITMIH